MKHPTPSGFQPPWGWVCAGKELFAVGHAHEPAGAGWRALAALDRLWGAGSLGMASTPSQAVESGRNDWATGCTQRTDDLKIERPATGIFRTVLPGCFHF
jgi:hypothetical protein